jgi:hypothetical protein
VQALSRVVEFIGEQDLKTRKIVVAGYSDTTGLFEQNKELSLKLANRSWERERRAKAAAPVPSPIAPSPAVPQAQIAPTDSAAGAQSPERYCSNKRSEAARDFADARSATDAAARERLLQRSLESLDACIARHPGTPEAEKARQNRERVQQELKR